MFMRRRGAFAAFVLWGAACGGQSLIDVDGGGDSGSIGEAGIDATIGDAKVDVVVDAADASADGAFEAGLDSSIDAPFVDLDAASAPWAQDLGAGSLSGVAVDSNLDILVGGELTALSSYISFYLQELDSNGNLLWKKTVGTSTAYKNHTALGVAFDGSGNMIATGLTDDAIDLGGGTALGPGTFIVKYDANGKFLWEFGPFPSAQFTRVATRSNGNVVVVGSLRGSVNFGNGTLTSTGYADALMVEVTSAKTLVTAKSWGGGGQEDMLALAVDHHDNLFMTGRFEGTIDFGGGAMTGPANGSGSFNTFIAKLDANNAYVAQMQVAADSNNDGLGSIAVDWADDVWVTGFVGNTMNLGGKDLTCSGTVIGRLDNSLNHLWSGCYTHGSGGPVAISPIDTALHTGAYQGTINFGQGTLSGTQGTYFASFDSSGKATASFGSPWQSGNFLPQDTTYLTWPDFVVAGQCSGSFNLPSGLVTCNGTQHALVARLTP